MTNQERGEEADCQFAIVVSTFNEIVTSRLLAAAESTLTQLGTPPDHRQVIRVPGAFEIPLIAKTLAQSHRFDAVICLGAVIRGDTPHFEYICAETSRGIGQAALETGIPIIFGVLTTDTVDQAMERSGSPERNKGADAARSALEMAVLMKRLSKTSLRQSGFLRESTTS
ncbi:6,7-dimethyl-8-ribityllumazine synthase [Candidatus Nitrospira allomarina]|jgi:6,7-dimethyl-8-ribityllumazine synthase|uniref:6,7-dimethyl-8-ribityllumazine synthase n=1 Tax=Candidatus Nitrospira allomarina TaxID=3020900 RepID=A0AA96G8L6_9BACT|nr:6,7-dimethyl-8-ribityllumazine synthase [Candidatus Nitrospira allomarina]WNM57173.1 6,7-dimethyl-8-ribityllumazine synthase [Candidatus Nitrospira allomarina]